MQTYDIIMLSVLLAATVWGAWKGLAWQVASLGAIFASYVVAYNFREPVAEHIDVSRPWNLFLAMLILYLATSAGIWILFRLVSELIDRVKLKEFDRQLGAIFGFAKGALLCIIITLFAVTLLGDGGRENIVSSKSGHYIAQILNKTHTLMPEEIHEVLDPYIHTLDDESQRQRLRDDVEDRIREGFGRVLEAHQDDVESAVRANILGERSEGRSEQGSDLVRPSRPNDFDSWRPNR